MYVPEAFSAITDWRVEVDDNFNQHVMLTGLSWGGKLLGAVVYFVVVSVPGMNIDIMRTILLLDKRTNRLLACQPPMLHDAPIQTGKNFPQ